MSALTYSSSVFATSITGTAPEDANQGPGDDLTVNQGVFLIAFGLFGGGDITLSAGDDVFIHGTLEADAGKTISIAAGDADLDGLGTLTIDGDIGSGTVRLSAVKAINLGGTITATMLDLAAGDSVVQLAGTISAGRLQSATGLPADLRLDGGTNAITTLGPLSIGGDFKLIDDVATLTIDDAVSAAGELSIVNRHVGGAIVNLPTTSLQHLRVLGPQTYTLTFNGQTTSTLSDQSTEADIAAALNALSTIGGVGGSVSVTPTPNRPLTTYFDITFGGTLAGTHAPLLVVATNPDNASVLVDDGTKSMTGDTIVLVADRMTLDAGDVAATGRMRIAPATSGTEVALGSFPVSPTALALDDATLAHLFAPILEIGREDPSNVTAGSIHIGSAHVGSGELRLFARGSVTLDDGFFFQVAGGSGEIRVMAGGPVFLGDGPHDGFDAALISGSTTSGYFSAVNTGAHALTANGIGTEGGAIQVVNYGGDLLIDDTQISRGGNIKLGAAGALTIQADVDAGAGAIGLFGETGDIIHRTGRLVGHNLLAQINTNTASGSVGLNSPDNAISGHVVLAAGSGFGDITFSNSLAYTIGGLREIIYPSLRTLDAAYSAGIVTSMANEVTLTAGSDIDQAHSFDDRIVTGTLNLYQLGTANPNVTLDNLFNAIATLGAVYLGSGNLKLMDDVATLTIKDNVSANDISIVNREAGGVIQLASTGAISGHTIELIADDLGLDDGSVTATDSVLLAPFTFGTEVTVGDSVSSPFWINRAELDKLSTPTLTIGRDGAGNVTAGAIHLGQGRFNGTLDLFAQGDIRTEAGPFRVNGTLNADAGGMVSLQDLQVSALGGSAVSHFVAHSATSFTANAITTAGGEITLSSSGDLAVAGAFTSHGGNVRLAGDQSLDLGADIDAGSGAIGLTVNHTGINQSAGKLVGRDLLAVTAPNVTSGGVALTSADNAITGHVVLGAQQDNSNISFTNSVAYMIGGLSQIDYLSAASLMSSYAAGISTSTRASTTLTAGGDITQGAAADDRIITGMLELARLGAANPNITLDNAFNEIDRLGAVDLGSGALTLVDAADLLLDNTVAAGSLALTTGRLTFRGGSVTTSGAQTYHADLRLRSDTWLTGKGITIDGAVSLDVFGLTLNSTDTGTIGGVISGRGSIFKEGSGTIIFVADETYTGTTRVNGGTLIIDGAMASQLTTVAAGATLGGHGSVGALTVASGGTLAPGDSPGILTTGDVALDTGAHVSIELGGTITGKYDQLAVHGSVLLGGATLDAVLVNNFAPAGGDRFIIIDNDGTDAIGGKFLGLDEGALLAIGGIGFSISYHGGDGNDVVLTALANHAPVNTVPGAQSVTTGTDLVIAGLSIGDQDAGSGILTTTLSVAHGTLSVAPGHAAISGDGSATVTLTGTLAEIDATLAANVTYRAQAGFTGADALTMVTSDNGNTGLGGALTDTDTVRIDVNPTVRLPPVPVVGTDGDDSFTAPAGDSAFIGKRGVDTISFNFKLTDATVSYAGSDIIIDGPNGASHTIVTGVETFIFTDGTVSNRDGNPLIDDLYYYSRYHDVWNAHVDADTHFNTFGWREGRDPNAWFDTQGYLSQYADVRAAGVNPLTHYDQFGWREGRDPSTAFDTGDYLSHYADVAAAHVDPLAHFLTWAGEEARTPFNDGVWG